MRRVIGVQISFAEYHLFYRALFQKRPIILMNEACHRHTDIIGVSPSVFQRLYGVASISRLLKIIGLFCRISSLLQGSFAKETCNFQRPTSRSHRISHVMLPVVDF